MPTCDTDTIKFAIMEEKTKNTERLARYIIIGGSIAIIGIICWFFRSVLGYIIGAIVLSLIARPIMKLLNKIRIKGKTAPQWLLAVITMMLIISLLGLIIKLAVPTITGIASNISVANVESLGKQISEPLADLNSFLAGNFPQLGKDFRLETFLLKEVQKIFDFTTFSSVLGSAASAISSFGVGLFAILFIGFFFIKDDRLFAKIVAALVPDRLEKEATKAIDDIQYLLTRYFGGLVLEIAGVALLNFLLLWLVARLNFNYALGIGFITGILNIIPYIGPLFGGIIGTIMGLILKYCSVVPMGLNVNFIAFVIILIAVFCVTQLVDNILYQPLIYSTSIKSNPLEIFIVILLVGFIGGPLAMIAAIPSYTVLRVIAFRFFGNVKAIRRLIPDEKLISKSK